MAYERMKAGFVLTKQQKIDLMAEYISYYETVAKDGEFDALNRKIPREAFAATLDKIGELLLSEAESLSVNDGQVKEFLDENPLPPHMAALLPENFRVFCLILNALKQWVSAESAATDRYLLGGTARDTCRKAVDKCIITGEDLGDNAELHHPVRDGRPPILLSKKGHGVIEGQLKNAGNISIGDDRFAAITRLKKEKHGSWIKLRDGCLFLLGEKIDCDANSKSFARSVMRETKLTPMEIISILDERGL